MKFTQNDAFKKIKSYLTRNGKDLQMSERSILEQIDSLSTLIANDEMELDDFVGKVKPMFDTMNNNAKKDISDFVNKWNDEHPVEPPKPQPQPQANPELDELRAQIAELKKQGELQEAERKLAERRKSLLDKMIEKGVDDKDWIDGFLSEVNITEDIDIDAKADSYVKLYNKSQARVNPRLNPPAPQGGNVLEAETNVIKQAAERAKRQNSLNTI